MSFGVNQSSMFKWLLPQNCLKINGMTLFSSKAFPLISAGPQKPQKLTALKITFPMILYSIILISLQEIAPTPCPLACGLEFKNPTSLDVHLKGVHSVTKQQIKHAQRIQMSETNF